MTVKMLPPPRARGRAIPPHAPRVFICARSFRAGGIEVYRIAMESANVADRAGSYWNAVPCAWKTCTNTVRIQSASDPIKDDPANNRIQDMRNAVENAHKYTRVFKSTPESIFCDVHKHLIRTVNLAAREKLGGSERMIERHRIGESRERNEMRDANDLLARMIKKYKKTGIVDINMK